MAKLYIGNTAYKVMLGNNSAHLPNQMPYDAEIEYLGSSGTQWIDTGILANGEFEFEYKFRATNLTGNTSIGGARSVSQMIIVGQISSYTNFVFGYLDEFYTFGFNTSIINNDYTINIIYKDGQQQVYINGNLAISRTDTGTEELNLPIYLYKRNFYNVSDTLVGLIGRFYYFRMKQNGVLVRDFIPVRVGTIGYMYDKVSNQLFGNAGTGDFILGQDKVIG